MKTMHSYKCGRVKRKISDLVFITKLRLKLTEILTVTDVYISGSPVRGRAEQNVVYKSPRVCPMGSVLVLCIY